MDGGVSGVGAGGIYRLGRVASEHPHLLAADFREMYGVSPWGVPIREACLLLRALLEDSRSRVAAQAAGWKHPATREWMMLAQLHDAVIDTTPGLKDASRYHMPRPWPAKGEKLGGSAKRTAAEALAILRPHTK